MSKLLIVESPTKAKTIGRMLGKGFEIQASMGHIRDLPEHEFGIDVAHGFAPSYVDTPRSRSIVKSLRSAAKNADEIYLAPDPDREGEAIAWHLKSVLSPGVKAPFYRVTFHEITRNAIEQALAHRGEIDQNRVDAQQARRVLDRIVGYQVSPLLWRKLEKGSSAGRVQSAALRLVVEREREIQAFKPQEYWNFSVDLGTGNDHIAAKLFKIDGKDFTVSAEKDAAVLEAAVRKGSRPCVSAVTRQERRRNVPPPFTTSTMQQTANQLLHYSASSTMRYAQQLYEGIDIGSGSTGLITYMRTDSMTIAREAQVAAAAFIRETYGAEFAPEKFNVFRNKAAAQEAHEAIRPTDVRRTPESLAPYLDGPLLKLYTLIWKRFVASQMSAARQDLTTADVQIKAADGRDCTFRAAATVTRFPGFLRVMGEKASDETTHDAAVLALLKEGDLLTLLQFLREQKFTEPPPRFNEATLIKALEENGIGRPSTYATILRTIQDRGYVQKEQSKLLPSELGFTVNDFLVEKLPELFDIGFTAEMETELDEVEEGKRSWVGMMTDFYSRFLPWIKAAKESGAPPEEKAQEAFALFDNIKYDEPRKVGRRTYDDRKFVDSLLEKYQKDHKITERQYQALLALASRYFSQLSPERLAALSPELREQLENGAKEFQKRSEQQQNDAAAAAGVDYASLFGAFDKVNFAPPRGSGRSAFDDGKFFASLKKQALSGKVLSAKQTAALGKLAVKYRAQLTDAEKVFAILSLGDVPEAPDASPGEAAALLQQLSAVTAWAEPVKRGRFTFDDKKFYDSLARQNREGRSLSEKQLAALRKLAAKYSGGK